eukprot:gene10512-7480_t
MASEQTDLPNPPGKPMYNHISQCGGLEKAIERFNWTLTRPKVPNVCKAGLKAAFKAWPFDNPIQRDPVRLPVHFTVSLAGVSICGVLTLEALPVQEARLCKGCHPNKYRPINSSIVPSPQGSSGSRARSTMHLLVTLVSPQFHLVGTRGMTQQQTRPHNLFSDTTNNQSYRNMQHGPVSYPNVQVQMHSTFAGDNLLQPPSSGDVVGAGLNVNLVDNSPTAAAAMLPSSSPTAAAAMLPSSSPTAAAAMLPSSSPTAAAATVEAGNTVMSTASIDVQGQHLVQQTMVPEQGSEQGAQAVSTRASGALSADPSGLGARVSPVGKVPVAHQMVGNGQSPSALGAMCPKSAPQPACEQVCQVALRHMGNVPVAPSARDKEMNS